MGGAEARAEGALRSAEAEQREKQRGGSSISSAILCSLALGVVRGVVEKLIYMMHTYFYFVFFIFFS